MSQWVVVKSGGIGRTRSVIGPFDGLAEADQYCAENDMDMRKTNIKPIQDP